MKQFISQKVDAKQEASLIMNMSVHDSIKAPKFRYHVECRDKNGNLKWVEDVKI